MNKHLAQILNQDTFSNFHRQFLGFGDLLHELETFSSGFADNNKGYPPYNIIEVAEDQINVELAIAGFAPTEVSVTVEDGVLSIVGEKTKTEDDELERNYRYRGISTRKFTRTFRLANYWEVQEASFKDGILTVSVKQEIPEEKKPRTINIRA